MSGWQLGLVLFGVWLAGVACGLVAVWSYGRHLLKSKLEGFVEATTAPVELPGHVEPPPGRRP